MMNDEWKMDQNKRQEEEQMRQNQAQKEICELVKKHKNQMDEKERLYEENARKQAEEFNEFKERHKREYEALKREKDKNDKDLNALNAMSVQKQRIWLQTHLEEIKNLVKCVSKKRGNVKKISELLMKHEEEINKAKQEEMEDLQFKHEKELHVLFQNLLGQRQCVIL